VIQEVNRQGRQCGTAPLRHYGNTRRRFKIGVAPVAITTLYAPPPLTAGGTDLHLHDRRPPMMNTTELGFTHLNTTIFRAVKRIFVVYSTELSRLASAIYEEH
jgi:hypothetical protein